MAGPILLVEDNDDDVFLLTRALERAQVTQPVHRAETGQSAIDYLHGAGRFSDRNEFPIPCLVLLDLKLPEMPGLEVLKWIRTHADYRTLPVIVLSSSNQDLDIKDAYQLGANSYLVKPPNLEALIEMAQMIKQYWLAMNRMPRKLGLRTSDDSQADPG